MYKHKKISAGTLDVNESTEGERIEDKINRMINNGEPITDSAPIIYTERKDGVQPAYDIRADKQEVAIGLTDALSKTNAAKREENYNKRKEALEKLKENKDDNNKEKGDGKTESIQGTGGDPK